MADRALLLSCTSRGVVFRQSFHQHLSMPASDGILQLLAQS